MKMLFFVKFKLLLILFVSSLILVVLTGFLASSVAERTNQAGTITPVPTGVRLLQQFKVVSYQPTNSQKVSTLPDIKVTLSQDLVKTKAEIRLDPSVPLAITISGAAVNATPQQPLEAKTTYHAALYLEGSKFFEWQFTTIEQTANKEDTSGLANIKTQLPYQGDHFRVLYNAEIDKFQVVLDDKPVETYYQKALNWFKQMGIKDPSALKISKYLVGRATQP